VTHAAGEPLGRVGVRLAARGLCERNQPLENRPRQVVSASASTRGVKSCSAIFRPAPAPVKCGCVARLVVVDPRRGTGTRIGDADYAKLRERDAAGACDDEVAQRYALATSSMNGSTRASTRRSAYAFARVVDPCGRPGARPPAAARAGSARARVAASRSDSRAEAAADDEQSSSLTAADEQPRARDRTPRSSRAPDAITHGRGAGLKIAEQDLTPRVLADALTTCLGDFERLVAFAEAARGQAHADAAERLAAACVTAAEARA